MRKLPLKLEKRLQKRKEDDSFRKLLSFSDGVDLYSNDYLGFSRSEGLSRLKDEILKDYPVANGATGSRLLSGNHPLFTKTEEQIAEFHNSESALIFNSGYDANIGFFSAVPQKNDLIFFDEYAHASIREGLQMSLAKKYKFRHNDLADLETKVKRSIVKEDGSLIYIVTESVFSMDGDSPDLEKITALAEKYNAYLIVDEAHATGVLGNKGQGLIPHLGLENRIFARIYTFGKAMGAHGAAILGGKDLKDYLINYCRSFIYTTALSPHAVATISAAYGYLETDKRALNNLRKNIQFFRSEIIKNGLQDIFVASDSAIQVCIISGNTKVKLVASELQNKHFSVKPILSPTVPAGSERLRFCIHSYNSFEEISQVLKVLGSFVTNKN